MDFFRNVTGLLLTSAVRIPVALASSVILARFLSTDDRGLYAVATGLGAMLTMLSMWGWPAAAIYRLRRVQSDPAKVASAGLLALGLLSLLVVGLGVALEPWLSDRFLDGAAPELLYLAIAVVPLHLIVGFLTAFARALDRFALDNWGSFLETSLTCVGYGLVLVVWDGGLYAALATILVVQAGLTVWLLTAVLRHSGLSLHLELGEIRASFRYGAKSYLQGMAGRLHERVDIFMLAWFLAPSEVALYAIATGLVSRLKMLPNTIAKAAFPQMSGLDDVENVRFTCRVSRQSAFWAFVTAIVLLAVAPIVIRVLYGEAYLGSIAPFMLLLPGTSLLTLYRVLSRYFSSIDRQQVNIVTQMASATLNVGLNLVLIPRYGILGAAGASLVSYALESIWMTWVFVRATDVSYADVLIPKKADIEAYRGRLKPMLRRLKLA